MSIIKAHDFNLPSLSTLVSHLHLTEVASCHKMVVGTLVLLLISVRMFQNSSEVPVAGWLKSDLPKVSSCLCKPCISHRWARAGNVYTVHLTSS